MDLMGDKTYNIYPLHIFLQGGHSAIGSCNSSTWCYGFAAGRDRRGGKNAQRVLRQYALNFDTRHLEKKNPKIIKQYHHHHHHHQHHHHHEDLTDSLIEISKYHTQLFSFFQLAVFPFSQTSLR